jgi:hypothetical protein
MPERTIVTNLEAHPPAEAGATTPVKPGHHQLSLNEDWLAAITGLVLLALVLTGVLTADVVL